MNTGRIVIGGLAAGLWMNVAGFLINGMLLGKRMEAEMIAAAPTLQGRGMSGGAMAGRVLGSFAIGLLIAWLYAAMRPRFGAGMKTAVLAAIPVWVCGFVFYLDWAYMDMMTPATYAIVSLVMAVTVVVAGAIAGALYREGGGSAAA